MLDALQIEYVGQLTRYLTDQFVCSRFAISLPGTYFHFIQNVMLPDDLPSYKSGQSRVKTKYDLKDTLLCSADVFLKDFCMIGSLKFQDMAYDEKKKSVAESKLVLRESRVHIDFDSLGCKVQYVSDRYHPEGQSVLFGIPQERQYTHPSYHRESDPLETDASELVVLDLLLNGFSFKWLGAKQPNYCKLEIGALNTIIITEAVEILVGAVYSWLVFVDDLKTILESFQEQRSRQIQVFIAELAQFSTDRTTTGDPLFLTKPTNVLRLGSRNFRNDVGWKLLARMRYCLRNIGTSNRVMLQHRLFNEKVLDTVNSGYLFQTVVDKFSRWRNWEIDAVKLSRCRLFTQPFHQRPLPNDEEDDISKPLRPIDTFVDFLVTSFNLASVRLQTFDFCIYEEEEETEDNSIVIGPFVAGLECSYKRTVIGDERTSMDVDRATRDGYLDVVIKANLDTIKITTNPAILGFARHMLTVQRVFTAKLRSLSLATKAAAATTSTLQPPLDDPRLRQEYGLQDVMSEIDIVAHALVTLQEIDVCARAQKLTMQNVVRGIQSSLLFSNPKLTPLPMFCSPDRESEAGSGMRSSAKASRKNTVASASRIILEASSSIEYIDMRVYEMLATSYPLRELLVISLDGVNVNACINQSTRVRKQSSKTDPNRQILNVFSNIHKFNIHTPQSLLRLYGFIEDWRTEQRKRYEFLFHNLMSEWEEQRRLAAATAEPPLNNTPSQGMGRKFDIKLQFLLNEFVILADLLPSLSVEYKISDFFVMVQESQLKAPALPEVRYAFQLSKQELHLITQGQPTQEEYAGGTFSIPSIRSTGRLQRIVQNEKTVHVLRSTLSVDFISLSLDVGMIDSLLTAQSLVGNEISELIEVVSYSKQKQQQASPISPTAARDFKYTVDVALNGLRVTAESPSALGVFESNILEASLSNDAGCHNVDDRLRWRIKGTHFALSLEHQASAATDHRRNRLAYIVADFNVQNYPHARPNNDEPLLCSEDDMLLEPFYVNLSRVHTVMQPIALGRLAEMYIYYESELKKKNEQKKNELDRLADNTKRLVNSFKRDAPRYQEATHSLWEGKLISFTASRLGVAIPLDVSDAYYNPPKETPALLLSVNAIHFLTKNTVNSAALMDNISLQFVKRFDQNNEEHFSAEKHPRMNQMHLPSIACHVQTRKDKPTQHVRVDAKVGGFEVDIDGAFSEYLNALSIIYFKSKDRVGAFAHLGTNLREGEAPPERLAQPHDELVHLDIKGVFEYESGVVRMYPRRHSSEGSRRKRGAMSDEGPNLSDSTKMATVKIPGLTAFISYQTPLGALSSGSDSPRRFHGDMLIHESENTLHPSLVLFLHEIMTGLKVGMQQSSERKAETETSSTEEHINASLLVRLSKTKVHLTCQPASKVICSLSWDQSEFLMNAFSDGSAASRTMSLVGSLRNISGIIKHQFSPEACLQTSVDHVLFNAMLTSQRHDEGDRDDISIVVKIPTISGDINMRHLQDLLVLQAHWLQQQQDSKLYPRSLARHRRTLSAESQEDTLTGEAHSLPTAPKPFARFVAIYTKKITLSVDMGPAIGKVTLSPEQLGIHTHKIPRASRGASISLGSVSASSEGRLSGNAYLKRLRLEGVQDNPEERERSENVSPTLHLMQDGFHAAFEYEYQHILDMVQEPLEFFSCLKRGDTAPELHVTIDVQPIVASVSIKTVPVMITMYKRFNDLLEKKKIEAGTWQALSAPAQPSQQPPPSETLPTVEITPATPALLGRVRCKVTIGIKTIEIVVYPNQFQDVDNVELYGQELQVELEEVLGEEEQGVARQLQISLRKAALLKNVQGTKSMEKRHVEEAKIVEAATLAASAEHSDTAPEPVASTATPADQQKKGSRPPNAPGVSIFGIPSTRVQMNSRQMENLVKHTFAAHFDGRINVSLNLGLIRYLQELINLFTAQLDRALQTDNRRRSSIVSQISATTTTNQTHVSTLSGPSSVGTGTAGTSQDQEEQNQSMQLLRADKDDDSGVSVKESASRKASQRSLKPSMGDKAENMPDIQVDDSEEVPEAKLVYVSDEPVNFYPQLQIMGDATPPVEWLGLQREKIPALVHENITLVLDELAQALCKLQQSK